MARRFRFLTVLFSLLVLLLSTAAVAGYACPGSEKALELAQMVDAGMPCAETMSRSMDDEQPGLCHAHCQSSQQTADNFQPPAFADLLRLGVVLTVRGVAIAPRPAIGEASWRLRRVTSPPLAVRNCCFRI
jgi:hypothetical protein